MSAVAIRAVNIIDHLFTSVTHNSVKIVTL